MLTLRAGLLTCGLVCCLAAPTWAQQIPFGFDPERHPSTYGFCEPVGGPPTDTYSCHTAPRPHALFDEYLLGYHTLAAKRLKVIHAMVMQYTPPRGALMRWLTAQYGPPHGMSPSPGLGDPGGPIWNVAQPRPAGAIPFPYGPIQEIVLLHDAIAIFTLTTPRQPLGPRVYDVYASESAPHADEGIACLDALRLSIARSADTCGTLGRYIDCPAGIPADACATTSDICRCRRLGSRYDGDWVCSVRWDCLVPSPSSRGQP